MSGLGLGSRLGLGLGYDVPVLRTDHMGQHAQPVACAARAPASAHGSPRGGPAPLGPACLRQGPHSRTRTRTGARTRARPALAVQVYWAKHRIELDATLQAL